MQKRPTSNGHLRKSQSQTHFPLAQWNAPGHRRDAPSIDLRLMNGRPGLALGGGPGASPMIPAKAGPSEYARFAPTMPWDGVNAGPWQSRRANPRLPPMTPAVKESAREAVKCRSTAPGERRSCSNNFPLMNVASPERTSLRSFKKPVVAAAPLFQVPDPQSDVLSTLQQLPDTIKREDFIELYFENIRLREQAAQNPFRLRQHSSPQHTKSEPVRSDPKADKENAFGSPKPAGTPNCYVNYVTNNFNLNFVSPFKTHLKNAQKEASLRPSAKADPKGIDFSKFFVKKSSKPSDLKIKRRNLAPLASVSAGSGRRPGPSDSGLLSTEGTPEPSPAYPASQFTFDQSPLLDRAEGLGEPTRLDFTFSCRPI